ncbi:MAG: hypothetical protein KC912_03525 [Proteobacteria bacterium]|nr:hypothetical protein [Pseudomonadota bacterium]
MASSSARSTPKRRPLLSHRRLLLSETVLVLGLVQMFARDFVLTDANLPAPLRVLFGMALILGLFGGLVFYVQEQVRWSLTTTHKAVQRLPLPTPMVFVHTLVFAVLFWCYAAYWQLDEEVWRSLVAGFEQAKLWYATRGA